MPPNRTPDRRTPPGGNGYPPPANRYSLLLLSYFRSGWAFLVPYLLVYFACAWLKWPVNPVVGGEGVVKGMSESAGASASLLPAPCSLLHFYWFLHVAHLLLGGFALKEWMAGARSREQGAGGSANSVLQSFGSSALRAAPWLGLALLFCIPGVYLEFPSDPWQHLARTNEWVWLNQVTEHSYWKKSSYFLAYSLIGRIGPPVPQLRWFDLYYTGCCLLLCWQYYRLARAVGLGERASLLFVLLNALVFGNNLFGFYRYYGMSSTVFAQLGAVALTRNVLEFIGGPRNTRKHTKTGPADATSSSAALPLNEPRHSYRQAIATAGPFSFLLSCVLLLGITAGNHIQGLLIAGAGVAAVVCWRLVAWRRSMIGWLALAAVVTSVATVLWWPRHPLIDSSYVPGGWLTSWYAFNLFQPSSGAFQRAWVMIGAFGGLNLAAAVWLLRRNHVVAWLTLIPVLLLCLPCFALPFVNSLAASTDLDGGYIIAFHRILFAIPAGLAVVALLGGRPRGAGSREQGERRTENGDLVPLSQFSAFRFLSSAFPLILIALVAFTTLPANGTLYNRLFNALMVPADDLQMKHVVGSRIVEEMRGSGRLKSIATDPSLDAIERALVLATPGIGYVMNSTGATRIWTAKKHMTWPTLTTPAGFAEKILPVLPNTGSMNIRQAQFPPNTSLFSVQSQTAALSGHWLTEEVALEHAAQAELFKPVVYVDKLPQVWIQWLSPRDQTKFSAKGAGIDLVTPPIDDRGRLDSGIGNQAIYAHDQITLIPVMRTFNGSGTNLVLTVKGPEFSSSFPIERYPNPLGGVQWIHKDHTITLDEPGRYDLEITGTTLWPSRQWTARYYFIVQPAASAAGQ